MKRFLALLVLGVLAILSLASVPQASAKSTEVVSIVCTPADAISFLNFTEAFTAAQLATFTTCAVTTKLLIRDFHYRLRFVEENATAAGDEYYLLIKGGEDD